MCISVSLGSLTLQPGPGPCSTRLDSARAGHRLVQLTLLSGTELNQKFLRCHHSKHGIYLLYGQSTTLCSARQLMMYNGMRAVLRLTAKPSQAQLASVPEWPSVSAYHHMFSPGIFARVNGLSVCLSSLGLSLLFVCVFFFF